MKKAISLAKEFGVSIVSLGLPLLLTAHNALALTVPVPTAPVNPVANLPQGNISSVQSVLNLVCVVFDWAFYFLIALSVLFIIVAAFKYLTAGGDPEKVKGAGSTLLYAAIAVAVALLARAVPLVVASFLGAGTLTTC
jgi:hypothetical protein